MPIPLLAAAFGGFFSTAIGQITLSIGLSALSTVLNRQSQPKSAGIRTETTTEGGTIPQTFVLGHYATAGSVVAPFYSWGTPGGIPNGYRTQIIDMSDLPINGVTDVWVDDKRFYVDRAPFSLTGPIHPDLGLSPDPAVFTGYAGNIWFRFYDGTQATADAHLLSEHGSGVRPWQADMIGRGVAYAILTYRYQPDLYQGEPRARFAVKGISLYDPREDTTAGGSGAHRWADQSTWEFTENPAVMVYNLLRGLPLPDGQSYGVGIASEDLPASWWFAAMNKCDQLVDGEPQYRAGYEVKMATAEDGGDTPLDVIDELLKAMDAEICDLGGKWIIRVGAPSAATVSITDEDILRSSAQDLEPFKGMAETFNAVRASHPSPQSGWQATEAPPRYDLDAEAEDGQRLVADIDLPAVPYPTQVQRLMRAWLLDARRMRRHTITLPPEYSSLTPLDTIAWSSDRNGYITKLFEISDAVIDPFSLSVILSIRERDPSDYDWQTGFELPTTAPTDVIPTIPPFPLPGFEVRAVSILDVGGVSRRAAIEMTWPASLREGVRDIAYQIRLAGGTVISIGSTADIEAERLVVSEGILPETDYEVRARGIERTTEWTNWLPVTTLPAQYLVGDEATRLREAGEDARNAGRDAADNARELLRGVLSSYENRKAIRGDVAIIAQEQTKKLIEGQEALVSTRETLLAQIGDNQAAILRESVARATADEAIVATSEQLSARVGTNEAAITTEQLARADGDSALAGRIDTIEAEVDANAASIVSEQVARANADSALATDITTLTATVNGNTASLEANAVALADIDGTLTASYLWRARAGGATGEIELVAGSSPEGASSLFRVSADRLQFLGDFTQFFGNVEITGNLIANGAVSQQGFGATNGGVPIAVNSGTEAAPIWISTIWLFSPASYRNTGGGIENPVIWDFSADLQPQSTSACDFRVILYGRINGTATWEAVDATNLMIRGKHSNWSGIIMPFPGRRIDYDGDVRSSRYEAYRVGAYAVSGATELARITTSLQQISR